ncbi:MAG: Coq4 family protein, partial [Rhodopila sp.]|nr:Coq4 family protein [Rhodopila sp.]
AVSRLIRSRGQDKRQAMTFLHALEGQSGRRAFERFRRTPVGQRVLRDRSRLLDTLTEAEAADRFPPGTLGHAYHCFLRREGMSVAGLMDFAMSPRESPLPEDERFVEERSAVMHDLWHVVTGYDASVLGEVCLMAFRCAQAGHLGFTILTLFMAVKPPRHAPGAPVRRAMAEAYRIGQQAEWLRGADWEALLPMKLETVQRLLALRPPVTYHRVLAINSSQCLASGRYDAADTAAPAT